MTMLFVSSCSKYDLCKENDFGYMMNDFYNCHFRYPKSSEDYCNMFYKNDSLNGFVFACLQSGRSEVPVASYREYNAFMDSTYDVHVRLGDYGMLPYFSWSRMYKNKSNDDFKCTKNKVIFYNKEDDTRYYAYTVIHVVRKWLYGKKEWNEFDIQEKQLIYKYRSMKMCVNDSLVLNLPDSLFDYQKAYREVFNKLEVHAKKVSQKHRAGKMRHYLIRYYGNGELISSENKCPLPKDIVYDTLVTHYLDSCMSIDSRIKFIQFGI